MIFINNKIHPKENPPQNPSTNPQYSRDIQTKKDLTQNKRGFIGMLYFRSTSGCSACNR